MLLSAAPSHTQGDRGSASYWLRNHGAADRDARLVVRAHDVFARVAPAAETRRGARPRLVVVDEKEELIAEALRDGSIILSRAVIELCYRQDRRRRIEAGDTRLAFVMAHELAHLAAGDLAHSLSFDEEATAEIVERGDTPEMRQLREILADKSGVQILLMAGYQPRHLWTERRSFFEEWVAYIEQQGGRLTASAVPPGPASGDGP